MTETLRVQLPRLCGGSFFVDCLTVFSPRWAPTLIKLLTGVNALCCCKNLKENVAIIFAISRPERCFLTSSFLRRDRKAYANNPSYCLPLSTKN